MVKLLLDANTAVNESVLEFGPPGSIYPTVLGEAIRLGNPEIVRLLAEAGATLEEPDSILRPKPGATYEGKTVEEVLKEFWSGFRGSQDYRRIAAEKESLYKELDAKGLLVREEVRDANAKAPLALAIWAGREKVVAVLLEAGANPNVSVGGKTRPLHLAVQTGHPGIVKLLIKAGADVNQLDAEGKSPLGLGSYKGDIADMLRAAGAKVSQKAREEIPAPRIEELEAEPAPDLKPAPDGT
jgi:ankyrin repeat protein